MLPPQQLFAEAGGLSASKVVSRVALRPDKLAATGVDYLAALEKKEISKCTSAGSPWGKVMSALGLP